MSATRRSLGDLLRFFATGGTSVVHHWAIAGFSLAAAFGIWMIVQDVDNPRVIGEAPFSGGIQVVAVNVPEGYAVEELPTVRVQVEARKSDLADLRASDFRAEVDIDPAQVQNGVTPQTRFVRVQSKKSGVDVLSVQPSTLDVTVIEASTKDVPVTLKKINSTPAGFLDTGDFSVSPAAVTVRGRKDVVDRVAAVELEVNLANARDSDYVVEGDLVARASDGSELEVSMSQTRARATLKIEQVFAPRSMALFAQLTGTPAAGYLIASISIDPPVVLATGEKSIIDGLTGPLNLEKIDVTGAKQTITVTRQIDRPPNVSTDRPSAVVKVEIVPIECGTPGAACQSATVTVSPTFDTPPTGLHLDTGIYIVQVQLSGPIDKLVALKVGDVKATISLAAGVAGQTFYTAKVTAPAGIRVDEVEPLALTLIPNAP